MRVILSIWIWVVFSVSSALAAPPPEAFGELPMVYDAAISPNGKQIAAFVNQNGHYGVTIFSTSGDPKSFRGVGLEKGIKPLWIKWAHDNRVLISF